jgi:Bacterial SH3 domain
MEVRVVGRQSGWVQIANSDGSQTGWVYEKLVEPVAAPNEQSAAGTEAAQPENQSRQAKGQSGWVKVLGSPAGMRSSPSQSSPILFAFPEGRELRVVSRQARWVQVTDPGSKQSGWVAETSLVASAGNAKQQQAAGASTQQDSSAGRDGKGQRALRRNGAIRRRSVQAAMLDRRPMRAQRGRRLGRLAGGCPGMRRWDRRPSSGSLRIGHAAGGVDGAASPSSTAAPGRTKSARLK